MLAENILIIEDEPVVALDLSQTLKGMGHSVCGIGASYEAAMAAVASQHPSLVLMDIHLQGRRDGIEACAAIYQRWRLPVIFVTAYADETTIARAVFCKPFGYITKPFDTRELSAVIQVARSRHDVELALKGTQERLALAMEAAELGTWEWESRIDMVTGDERFRRLWGGQLTPFEAGLEAMIARVHPEDQAQVQACLLQPGFFTCQFRARRDSGEFAWLEMYGNLHQVGTQQQRVVGAMRDVTQRIATEERLRQASVVFNTIAEGILILDANGHIASANPSFTRLTGHADVDVIGHLPSEFVMFRREQEPNAARLAMDGSGYWSGEVACRCKDGRVFPALQQVCAVRDEAGKPARFVVTLSDISAIREAERKLLHLAYHDPLTGLGNRYLLDQSLQSELERCRTERRSLAILYLDLDGFKAINDSMGHHIGDRVIQEAANRISAIIRRHDEAVRVGGDEFVVIAADLRHAGEGLLVAHKVLRSLSDAIVIDEQRLFISASVGVAVFPDDAQNAIELLSAADSAMYEAKRRGKARVCGYTSHLVENVRTRLKLEQSLYGAIERGELVLHYQPVVTLDGFELIGFEALVRWAHPALGLLGPDKFIPIAEENNLILPIGAWVLGQAVAQLSRWNAAHGARLTMAVNVSPKQFWDEGFLAQIEAALRGHRVAAALLEIEITESTLQDFNKSRAMVLAMRELGVSVAIDDFGTGFSSLSLLKHLPISRVKIDRSFISALPGTARDSGLVEGILQMSRSLELQVTAEGIETAEQAQSLQQLGCPAGQGYLFSRPLPLSELDSPWMSRACREGLRPV